MNRKEIMEIKKIMTIENCTITRITGVYVDVDKERSSSFVTPFLGLPDEEILKYLDIFRKTLSGKIGKNLNSVRFERDKNLTTAQQILMVLRDSGLKDIIRDGTYEAENLKELYNRIVTGYVTSDPYIILIAHGVYDIPGVTSDNKEVEDGSEEVYTYLLCCICPVKLSKAGLCREPSGKIGCADREWMVDAPAAGFLFPAFYGRSNTIDRMLYYQKKPDPILWGLLQELGCSIPRSLSEQQEAFREAVQAAGANNFDAIKELMASLENEARNDIRGDKTLKDSQVLHTDDDVQVSNVTGQFLIEVPGATVKIDPSYTDRAMVKTINGTRYLMVEADSMTVNGIEMEDAEGEEENHGEDE